MQKFLKDPEAILDFSVDWSSWLASGETISSFAVTAPDGLTQSQAATETAGVVTIWLSGGTAGQRYTVECLVTTSAGRTDERSFQVQAQER